MKSFKIRLRRLSQHKKVLLAVEIIGALALITIFTLKIASYLHINVFDPASIKNNAKKEYAEISYSIGTLKFFGTCDNNEIKIDTGWQYVCRDKTTANKYVSYYDKAPRDPDGIEVAYAALNETDSSQVTNLMNHTIAIKGFPDTSFSDYSNPWQIDPYKDDTWQFNYYSLRFLVPLLNDAYTTRNQQEIDTLVSYVDSYTQNATSSSYASSNPYTVAWRSMVMSDIWWKLRSINALPITTSTAMLQDMEKQGSLLMQSSSYDPRYGNGTDEAVALMQLGKSMSFLPDASGWLQKGSTRFSNNFTTSIDNDGALKNYSASYQFDALAKYWSGYAYANRFNIANKQVMKTAIDRMINYSTYLLQPNQQTPVVNTSYRVSIHNKAEYAEIAAYSPEFKYAITKGKQGKQPSQRVTQFTATGQTIFRSGWNASDYTQATQVLFNYAPSATNYSQGSNLSLDVYGKGQNLLTSPGSYDINKSNPLHDYFYGTSAQNTVVVDGKNQNLGSADASSVVSKNGYATQSASNTLTPGITHEREVMQLSQNVIIVIDNLHANDGKQHTFDQRFNFDPSLSVSQTAHGALGKSGDTTVEIKQLTSTNYTYSHYYNQTDPKNPGGICSEQKDQVIPCFQLSTSVKGSSARFVTMITIDSPQVTAIASTSTLNVAMAKKTYAIALSETQGHAISATSTDVKAPAANETILDTFANTASWTSTNGVVSASPDAYDNKPSISITGNNSVMTKAVNADLTHSNLLIRMKVLHPSKLQSATITLESGNKVARLNLMNAYKSSSTADIADTDTTESTVDTSLGWSTISLAKGAERANQGQWSIVGDGFDWSKITRIDLSIASNDGSTQTVLFSQLSTTPEQKNSSVSIVFDDGSTSITPAVDYMNANNMQGSVGVIGKYSSSQSRGYLNVSQLHQLKDHDWSLVNHSYYHVDGPATYSNTGDLDGFKADILEGAKFLQDNNLNNTANWYIYPHGTTNQALESIVGKYYKFARTEQTGPETFPFGSPLAVKDYVVYDTTTPEDVEKAINDAQTYNQTLILTFHRIHKNESDKSGYDYTNFTRIIDYLKQHKANVLTLAALDASKGLTENKLTITDATNPQIESSVKIKYSNLLESIKAFFSAI